MDRARLTDAECAYWWSLLACRVMRWMRARMVDVAGRIWVHVWQLRSRCGLSNVLLAGILALSSDLTVPSCDRVIVLDRSVLEFQELLCYLQPAKLTRRVQCEGSLRVRRRRGQ
jgi:hypothetical protein